MSQPDQLFGKAWSINKNTSLFSTNWKPDSETRLYEAVPGDGYRLTVAGVHNGKAYRWGYTAFYDGKDHPVYGREDVDTIEAYRVNDKITIGFFKKDGIYGGPYARKLSEDGKSLTVQTVGKLPDGSAFFDVIDYSS
ncbi:hypothetical protein [Pseudomonas koreensis]|uniref:hypothetical protein n=1 Tax=Pseudomonas koreensis TaxID=198620 RepID=UPI003825AFC5